MRLLVFAVALILSSVFPVRAASFLDVINNTGGGTTTLQNDIVGAGLTFLIGQLRLSLDPGATAFITYTYLGREAAFRNQFFAADSSVLVDVRAPVGTSVTIPMSAPGLLDFGFRANMGPSVVNGSNSSGLFPQFGIVLNSNASSGLLLFDDGGAGRDRDFDDMVFRFDLAVRPVPEPTTWLLLAVGLVAVAFSARARTRLKL